MTTPTEKVALDLIFAALDSTVEGKRKADAVATKMSMLAGLLVHVCRENGIPKHVADELLSFRWKEYSVLALQSVHDDA
jgi:hypothetical protein